MYDHIGLKVRNLDASVKFYTAALAPLGHVLCSATAAARGSGQKMHRHFGCICRQRRKGQGLISLSAPPTTMPSRPSIARD